MKTIIRKLSWDILGSVFGSGSEFIVLLFLARILLPIEFGTIAIFLSIVYIFNIVSEFGFKQALIFSQDPTREDYSSVFFFILSLGLLMSVIYYFLCPSIIAHFNFPFHLIKITRWLTPLILINNLSLIHYCILIKGYRFKELNVVLICANFIAGMISIYLAYTGLGIKALVAYYVLSKLFFVLGIWIRTRFIPIFLINIKYIANLSKYSKYIFFSNSLGQIIARLDDLLIGKLFSPITLGHFGRANSIMDMTKGISSRSVNNVLFPMLSSIQDNRQNFNDKYLRILGIISFGSFLVSGIFILNSELIIISFFGDNWKPAVFILELLMFKMFCLPGNSFLIIALISQGFSKQNFIASLIRSVLKLLNYLVALIFGFKAFLIGVVTVGYLNTLINYSFNAKYLKISLRSQLWEFGSLFIIFVTSLFLAYFIFDQFDSILRAIFFIIIYLLGVCLFRKKLIFEIVKNIISFFRK